MTDEAPKAMVAADAPANRVVEEAPKPTMLIDTC